MRSTTERLAALEANGYSIRAWVTAKGQWFEVVMLSVWGYSKAIDARFTSVEDALDAYERMLDDLDAHNPNEAAYRREPWEGAEQKDGDDNETGS